MLLAECTWPFIRKSDCLIQCFTVLSLFTHAFCDQQNTLSWFFWDGKMGAKFGFRGQAGGRCLWDFCASGKPGVWEKGVLLLCRHLMVVL